MERFGINLPLRNQYFVMRVGQSFADKGGKVVTNPESCLLDWPMTEVGREQILLGTTALCEIRNHVWAAWRRASKLALLTSNTGSREIARRTKQSVLAAWRHIVKMGGKGRKRRPSEKLGEGGGKRDKNAAPDEIHVFSSDFKVAKQTATVSCELFARDETVGTVNLQYTKLLRERSLGLGIDYGGFDACSVEDLQQVYALDHIDGSHTLGGVESCEQVLSRCMGLIRDIELSIVERQVVLITHNDVAHIIQTIFAGVRPGLHRRLPALNLGEGRELKFTASALAAGAASGDDADDVAEGRRARPHRHLRIYLAGSLGRERQKDVILQQVIPYVADLCQRRGGSLSTVDLRMTILQEDGLGPNTIADRLEALDDCNVLICLLDPAVEQRAVVKTEEELAKMPPEAMFSFLITLLEGGEGGRGAAEQFYSLVQVLSGLVQERMNRFADIEVQVTREKNPYMLRRDLEAARERGADKGRARMMLIYPGLSDVIRISERVGDKLKELSEGERAPGAVRNAGDKLHTLLSQALAC
jgi:broad specificity phosphatase PhoE